MKAYSTYNDGIAGQSRDVELNVCGGRTIIVVMLWEGSQIETKR